MKLPMLSFAVALALALGHGGPEPAAAQDIEQEVAQCRKSCFRTTCHQTYRSCLADRRNTPTQCVARRKFCEQRCITVDCAT